MFFVAKDLLDVVLDEEMRAARVVDVAPLTQELNRLVGEPFSWEELQAPVPADTDFVVPVRVVESQQGIQPVERSLFGVPVDVRDATQEDIAEIINAMQREHFRETLAR